MMGTQTDWLTQLLQLVELSVEEFQVTQVLDGTRLLVAQPY